MIAVSIASYAREELLQRVLLSLRACPALADGLIIIVNNSASPIRAMVDATGWPGALIIEPGSNRGCAGGTAIGLTAALRHPAVTEIMVVDDDAEVAPAAPAVLRAALAETGAALAVPMIVDEQGAVGWFPGLQDPGKWRVIKRPGLRPADYLAACGPEPVRLTWTAWPVIMFRRSAVEACGLPLEDLWYQGVDLEYTMRVTARLPGVFVPTVTCRHLPPPVVRNRRFYLRECGGLQNCFFIFLRLRHGRRALRHLPGNLWRFLRTWGPSPRVLRDFTLAFWRGFVRGRPQGVPGYDQFLQQWKRQS